MLWTIFQKGMGSVWSKTLAHPGAGLQPGANPLLPPLFSFPSHSVAATGTKLLNPNTILKIKTARDYTDIEAWVYELPSISHSE